MQDPILKKMNSESIKISYESLIDSITQLFLVAHMSKIPDNSDIEIKIREIFNKNIIFLAISFRKLAEQTYTKNHVDTKRVKLIFNGKDTKFINISSLSNKIIHSNDIQLIYRKSYLINKNSSIQNYYNILNDEIIDPVIYVNCENRQYIFMFREFIEVLNDSMEFIVERAEKDGIYLEYV